MPTYVYKFVETGETIEVQQAFTDDALTEAVHPGTGARMAVKKVFTPVGVTFKGAGFYKTDSRKGASTSSGSAAAKSDGASSGTAAASGGADAASGSSSASSTTSSSSASSSSTSSSTSPSSSSSTSSTSSSD
jgi:predicted nucleic acid-binding Zn ribbon protein